jgi:putative SOS response-associated peptidase YedK
MVPSDSDILKGYKFAPVEYVVIELPERAQRVADVAFWGLIPSQVKDPNTSPKPIKARAETVEQKPTFRSVRPVRARPHAIPLLSELNLSRNCAMTRSSS